MLWKIWLDHDLSYALQFLSPQLYESCTMTRVAHWPLSTKGGKRGNHIYNHIYELGVDIYTNIYVHKCTRAPLEECEARRKEFVSISERRFKKKLRVVGDPVRTPISPWLASYLKTIRSHVRFELMAVAADASKS